MRSLHRFLKTDRPFLMARKDGSKIIFRQDDTSRLLCHVRSGPHTDTDIRSLEGPRIIDTVTSHYRHHASSMIASTMRTFVSGAHRATTSGSSCRASTCSSVRASNCCPVMTMSLLYVLPRVPIDKAIAVAVAE